VTDTDNHRVLIWNQFPSCVPLAPATNCASITPANVVLGQPDFVSSSANNDGVGGSRITARSLADPTGVLFNGPS